MDNQCKMLIHCLLVASTDHNDGTSLMRLFAAGTTSQGMRPVHAERNEDVLFWQLPLLQPHTGWTNQAALGILWATSKQQNAVKTDVQDNRAKHKRERAPLTVKDAGQIAPMDSSSCATRTSQTSCRTSGSKLPRGDRAGEPPSEGSCRTLLSKHPTTLMCPHFKSLSATLTTSRTGCLWDLPPAP